MQPFLFGGEGCEPGNVYLVGAGPGDPTLLTCRALRLLQTAEIVIHDALITPEVLELATNARLINVGKRSGHHLARQVRIAEIMIEHSLDNKKVLRLKGGDPGLFGRVGEEMQALRAAGVQYELVPGISSVNAASGLSGISLTHRLLSSAVTIVTGHEAARQDGEDHLQCLKDLNHTLVILMGLEKLPEITEKLMEFGHDPFTPVAIVQSASTSGQKTISGPLNKISSIAHRSGIASPATVIVGKVAALSEELAWRNESDGPTPFQPGAKVKIKEPHPKSESGNGSE